MPQLGLPLGTQRDTYGDTPSLPLKNLFVTQGETEPSGIKLLGRPPLRYVSTTEISASASNAIYQQDGVNDDNRVAVFGSEIWPFDLGSSAGTLGGALVPSIAGNSIGVVLAAGVEARFWDGSTLQTISFPDSASVTKVVETQHRFVFLRADTHRYYWTLPGDNMLTAGNIAINGADYASAESEPDRALDILVYKDHLVIFGSESTEMHGVTGDDNLPWSRTVGSTIDEGIIATGCAALWNNTFVWVAQDYSVYRFNGVGKERISNQGIEQVLRSNGASGS